MYNRLLTFWMPLVAALFLSTSAAHANVTIDWVTVGDPGNTADDTGYGAVADVYRIGKYEVTNAQYAAFLNAVAATTDTYGLYTVDEITQTGGPGSYTYSAIAGREDMPVVFVSFWNALRFANWLHNGQPAGAQDSTTTEDGAYTITEQGISNNEVPRNAGATIFLTSEDEWYKAAYYDAVSTSYFDYPAGTDTQTVCAVPGATANTANCDWVVGDLTDVGSYTGSPSPSGTFDQGGNVREWNETIFGGGSRGTRGGGFYDDGAYLAAAESDFWPSEAWEESIGFRVASIPEPSTALLLAGGLAGLAAAGRRRRSRR